MGKARNLSKMGRRAGSSGELLGKTMRLFARVAFLENGLKHVGQIVKVGQQAYAVARDAESRVSWLVCSSCYLGTDCMVHLLYCTVHRGEHDVHIVFDDVVCRGSSVRSLNTGYSSRWLLYVGPYRARLPPHVCPISHGSRLC